MAELDANAGAGLNALGLNCTLKKSPEASNTEGLIERVSGPFRRASASSPRCSGRSTTTIPFGVSLGQGDGDEWPQILEKVKAADILIMGMSIWFGVRYSVGQMVIERLDGTYNETNEVGQYPLYNKVGGVVVTGNEDGAHACAETTLFNLTHLGCVVPPNADTYWVGDAGPGRRTSRPAGQDHPYTQRTSSWCAHNLLHMARILRETRSRRSGTPWRRRAATRCTAGSEPV